MFVTNPDTERTVQMTNETTTQAAEACGCGACTCEPCNCGACAEAAGETGCGCSEA
jgi:hypothetical protein